MLHLKVTNVVAIFWIQLNLYTEAKTDANNLILKKKLSLKLNLKPKKTQKLDPKSKKREDKIGVRKLLKKSKFDGFCEVKS